MSIAAIIAIIVAAVAAVRTLIEHSYKMGTYNRQIAADKVEVVRIQKDIEEQAANVLNQPMPAKDIHAVANYLNRKSAGTK